MCDCYSISLQNNAYQTTYGIFLIFGMIVNTRKDEVSRILIKERICIEKSSCFNVKIISSADFHLCYTI